MDPEKIGKFIKKIRKQNNLTQSDLANKYNVTYQAVSKWENGKNLPDISLIKQMSKDFNISIEDILEGEVLTKKNNKKYIFIICTIVLIVICLLVGFYLFNKSNFKLQTLSASCKDFEVSGSVAYDKKKSSIYISDIDYCGKEDNTTYEEITCVLYEKTNNDDIKIKNCNKMSNIKLDDYLNNIKIKIDNYSQTCKKYSKNSLYLEINAKDKDNKSVIYKVPLDLKDNC